MTSRLLSSPSRFVVVAVVLALAFAVPATAQDHKIAVINTERVLLDSTTGKAALDELQQLRAAKEAEGKAKESEIKGLQDQLAQGRLSLTEDKIADLERDLEEKTIEMRRFQDDANRELGKRRDKVLADVDRQVMPIIQAIGKESGYSLIFRKFESGLIFASEEVDITPQVIERLDAGAGG